MMMDVSVIVPTHNRAELLRRTLSSFREVQIPTSCEGEILVVVNACSDRTTEVVRDAARRSPLPLTTIEESAPGLNLARNAGLRAARGELVAFLDDDVWLEPFWLRALVEGAHQPYRFFAGRVTLEWESGPPRYGGPAVERLLSVNDLGSETLEVERPGQVVGANFAVRRSLLQELGGFRLDLDRRGSDLLSGGESELLQRALAAGAQGLYLPRMAVLHWIPKERTQYDYLDRLAFGRGQTRALLARDEANLLTAARLGLSQTVRGALREMGGIVRRNAVDRLAGRLLRQRGLGSLSGIRAQLRSGR